jgi:hypothetical protein
MTEFDFIGHFLDSIKEDCGNSVLLQYIAVICGDRDKYPTLSGHVLPQITMAIPNNSTYHPGTKRKVAVASTQYCDFKKRRGGSGG